jgi:hypothetical protein
MSDAKKIVCVFLGIVFLIAAMMAFKAAYGGNDPLWLKPFSFW